jgi:hypothetical protein
MEDEESKVRAIEAVTGSGGVNLGLLVLQFFCGLYGSGHERGKYFCCERSRFWVSLKKTHEIEVKSIAAERRSYQGRQIHYPFSGSSPSTASAWI